MSTPTTQALTAPAPAPEPAGAPAPSRPGQWLAAVTDPEWVPFLVVLLSPALLCLALGDARKASFFLGAGVYVATLRWLGWVTFGRLAAARPRCVLFAAEFFAGLAVACTWFYLRNLMAKAWPGSYGLRELSWLFPALVVLHLAALALSGPALFAAWRAAPRRALAALGERLAVYVPFVVALAVALWSISAALGVQGTDPILYALQARVYLGEGIDFAVPPTAAHILYPSGFAAMNATAAALAPLTVVQAFHLQHVLLWVTALFLVTGTVAALAGRPLPLLHSLPLPFLFVFPLYALYPDVFYPGAPKQAGPPLCAAVCLLPLLAPTGRWGAFLLAAGLVAMLAAVAAALNPACVPYALVALAVAVVIFVGRGWVAGRPRWRTAAALAALTLAAAALVLGSDPYYRAALGAAPAPADTPVTSLAPEAAPAAERPPLFSWTKGARAAAAVNPVTLSAPESTTKLLWDLKDHLKGWHEQWPALAVVLAVLVLALFALAGLLPRGSRRAAARDPLVRFVLTGVLLWLGLKYLVTFCAGGLSRSYYLLGLLAVYTHYVLVRCELLVLFGCLAAAGTWLYLTLTRHGLGGRRLAAVVLGGVAACWLIPALGLWAGVEVSGLPVVPTNDRFRVTEDDLKLAAWLDDNVAPGDGVVGLAAWTFRCGANDVEQHIYPLGGGSGLALYGKRYNYRFLAPSFEGDGGAAYEAHVHDHLDAAWCLQNGIRYFYATPEGLAKNPGLAAAVERGVLRPLRREGDSCVYEVTGGPAP